MIITDIDKLKIKCQDASIMEAHGIILKLEKELKISPGLGLAANQIDINSRVCIIRTKSKINLINPKIIKKYDLMEFNGEGCLSFPGSTILTKRYYEIVVQDLLHPAGIILTGLDAVVAQHEIEHLNGEVMFDYKIKRPKSKEECWCGSKKRYKLCHMKKVIRYE